MKEGIPFLVGISDKLVDAVLIKGLDDPASSEVFHEWASFCVGG